MVFGRWSLRSKDLVAETDTQVLKLLEPLLKHLGRGKSFLNPKTSGRFLLKTKVFLASKDETIWKK